MNLGILSFKRLLQASLTTCGFARRRSASDRPTKTNQAGFPVDIVPTA
jgi:hypothetical protein